MSASTCLQKTLLIYAPILLAIICVVRSRELSSPNHSLSSTLSLSSSSFTVDNVETNSTVSAATSGRSFNDEGVNGNGNSNGGGGGNRNGAKRKHKNHHKSRRNNRHNHHHNSMDADKEKDLTMWVNEAQVNMLSGKWAIPQMRNIANKCGLSPSAKPSLYHPQRFFCQATRGASMRLPTALSTTLCAIRASTSASRSFRRRCTASTSRGCPASASTTTTSIGCSRTTNRS